MPRLEADSATRRATLNCCSRPHGGLRETRDTYGDLSVLDTADYLYGLAPGTEHVVEIERGVQLYGLEAIGEPTSGHAHRHDDAQRQLRPVFVRDRPIAVEVRQAEKADTTEAGQVAAPFSGVVTLKAAVGDRVRRVSRWHPSRR
jgi:pyruvate carboxylase